MYAIGRAFLSFFLNGNWLGLPKIVYAVCFIVAIIYTMADHRAVRRARSDVEIYLIGIFHHEFKRNAMSRAFRLLNAIRIPWFRRHPFYLSADNAPPPINANVNRALANSVANALENDTVPPEVIDPIYKRLWKSITNSPKDLIKKYNGQLAKIKACNGDDIQLMYVSSNNRIRGKTLVICCEGNSGYNGLGMMITPIEAGFSVVGWHHPGPFVNNYNMALPSQGVNSVNAVVEYVIKEFLYAPDDIVIYGWSIGGFPAASAAVKYELKGLILDAAFDNLLPVANKFIPLNWSEYIINTIKLHLDLNIAKYALEYKRPVHVIRRTRDHVTCTEPYNISTDRINNLLTMLIRRRFCDLVGQSPAAQRMIEDYVNLSEIERLHVENDTYTDENQWSTLALLRTYSRDYDGEHSTRLGTEDFADAMDNIHSHDYNLQIILIKRHYYQHPPPKYVPLYKQVVHNNDEEEDDDI